MLLLPKKGYWNRIANPFLSTVRDVLPNTSNSGGPSGRIELSHAGTSGVACYLIFLLILQAIDSWKNTSLMFLICQYDSNKDRRIKSQYSVLADALEEKNSVKYNLYTDCVAKEKNHIGLQNIIFALAVLLPINFYHDQSILRIFGYKQNVWGLVIFVSFILFWLSVYQREFKIYVPEPFSLEMKTKN